MSTRIIRITECAQCPKHYRNSKGALFCFAIDDQAPLCPPTGTPDWCPLEVLVAERDGGSRE